MAVGLEDIKAALTLLAETYPDCFTAEQYLPHRPLKIGIDRGLAECCPALYARERGVVMRFYVSRVMYLQSLVEGAGRVDLDGNVCGEVTASDAEHARSRVAGIMAARDSAAKPPVRPLPPGRPLVRRLQPPRHRPNRHQRPRRHRQIAS